MVGLAVLPKEKITFLGSLPIYYYYYKVCICIVLPCMCESCQETAEKPDAFLDIISWLQNLERVVTCKMATDADTISNFYIFQKWKKFFNFDMWYFLDMMRRACHNKTKHLIFFLFRSISHDLAVSWKMIPNNDNTQQEGAYRHNRIKALYVKSFSFFILVNQRE